MNSGKYLVLVLVALQDELEGLLLTEIEGQGRKAWSQHKDLGGFRYHRRSFHNKAGTPFEIAAAWIGEMGQRSAAIRAQQLLNDLNPDCLAMCGICAGCREKVKLGDIIVAEKLYAFDEGKRVAEIGKEAVFYHSLRSFDLEAAWKMDASFLAREIDVSALESERPPSREAQKRWLLHTLYAHENEGKVPPDKHPERARACPGWSKHIQEALSEGLILRSGTALKLSDKGRDAVESDLVIFPDGLPQDPKLEIHLGAVAMVSAVIEDPQIFPRIRQVERNTLGLDMEGVALGEVAQRFKKRAIFVKAVQDFADGRKDDSFRMFGCRASAFFLLHFLCMHVEGVLVQTLETEDASRTEEHTAQRFDLAARGDGFLEKIERLIQVQNQGAKIKKYRTPPPFTGVLKVEIAKGRVYEESLVGVLEQDISREVVIHFIECIEKPYRDRDPLLRSTIIHAGKSASIDLIHSAERRGVRLQSLYEAQGLFDLNPYLEEQTRMLEGDERYLPSTYVDQPASIELDGYRERKSSENILATLLEWIRDPSQPRFALVLGDFGAGKTFLLRELCRRMVREEHPVWPVLVEMGKLEKRNTLKALLAAHFANFELRGYNFPAFEYMLSEGRIALLFDGYDELALRVDYGSATAHLETVLQAVQGQAKVIISSRRQHFLSDSDIKLELTEKAEQTAGYRMVLLKPFGESQIRRYLHNVLQNERETNERYKLIHDIKDLMGLSENPRMLSFIVKLPEEKLWEAKKEKGEIKSADLYEILVKDWLDYEHRRANPEGAPYGLTRAGLEIGIGQVARWLWHERQASIDAKQLQEELLATAAGGGKMPLEPKVVTHMFGSGSLLVRDRKPEVREGKFSFVHRSVMEWFLAREAAETIRGKGNPEALKIDEISPLMADFLWAMAKPENAIDWARRVLKEKGEGYDKRNAVLVLKRLNEPLSDINLESQDLRGRDLSGVIWRHANLQGADLSGATLRKADLTGADLRYASLQRVDLRNTILRGADLRGADLSGANLCGADLWDAKVLYTPMFQTKLVGVNENIFTPEWQPFLQAMGAALPSFSTPDAMVDTWPSVLYLRGGPKISYRPDGRLLAWVRGSAIAIYDAESGELLRLIRGHTGQVNAVAFNPGGSSLASASDDQTVRIWDASSGKCLRVLEGHKDAVNSVAFHPDGRSIATASDDRTARIWDTHSGECLGTLNRHQDAVLFVAYSPNGSFLATASTDKTARVWDTRSSKCLGILKGHQDWVNSVVFHSGGFFLATASNDQTARIWDIGSGNCLRVLKGHQYAVCCVAFHPEGSSLVTSSSDHTVRIWDTSTGKCRRILQGHRVGVNAVAFNPDGSSLATASGDQIARIWDTSTETCQRILQAYEAFSLSIAFHPGGSSLASTSEDKTARVWDINLGSCMHILHAHQGSVLSAAFSPDGSSLATSSDDRTVRLWDISAGTCQRVLRGHKYSVRSVAFNPQGSSLATASNDGTARLWDSSLGLCQRILQDHQHSERSMAFGSDGSVSVRSVAFGPDGSVLATASSDRTVRLWDVSAGTCQRILQGHHDVVLCVAFNPDGSSLATGSSDRTVRIWDIHTGACQRILDGHQDQVNAVAFSPKGTFLATASNDQTARIWDAPSGQLLLTLRGHTAGVRSVAFHPSGTRLVTASADGTIRIWSTSAGECLAILFPLPQGWVAFRPKDGRFRAFGQLDGRFFHTIGLCRFEPGELDPYLPTPLTLADDEPLIPEDW